MGSQRIADLISEFQELQVIGNHRWGAQPEGERAFAQALAFQATLRKMIERIVQRRRVPQSTIGAINSLLRNRHGYPQLTPVQGGFERRFHWQLHEAIQLLTPVAESASDLLCHHDLSLVKKCDNPACVLYFYDATKNHARRWCSMSVCGNRMKVAAHQRRHRQRPEGNS